MYIKKITAALFGLIVIYTNIAQAELFGSSERKSRNIDEFPKWVTMLERFKLEESLCDNQKDCSLNQIFQYINSQTQELGKLEKLTKVNRLVNSMQYIKDSDLWQKSDYWATPTEFFTKGGDCEDYAIAKFALLKELGFKNDDMRIVVLKNTFKNMIHSVLVVSVEGKQYLLDNEIPKVLQTKNIRHYRPIFSINEENWWKHRI